MKEYYSLQIVKHKLSFNIANAFFYIKCWSGMSNEKINQLQLRAANLLQKYLDFVMNSFAYLIYLSCPIQIDQISFFKNQISQVDHQNSLQINLAEEFILNPFYIIKQGLTTAMSEQFEQIEIYSHRDMTSTEASMFQMEDAEVKNGRPLIIYVPTYKRRFLVMTFIALVLLIFIVGRLNIGAAQERNNNVRDPRPAFEIAQIPKKETLTFGESSSNKIEKVDESALMSISKLKIANTIQPPLEILQNTPQNFDLWTIDDKYRDALLYLQSQHQQNQTITPQKSKYASITSGKDAETFDFFIYYEKESQVYNWHALKLQDKEKQSIKNEYNSWLAQRRVQNQKYIKLYQTKLVGKNGYMHLDKGIKNPQFLDSLDYHSLVGQDVASRPELRKIAQKQIEYYERKYSNSQYEKQLRACIVVPTYNNAPDHRYVWNLESILQQNYSNYRIVVVNDASKDATLPLIAKHLKWRQADPEKWILVNSKKHRTAMENIYYATHKFCGYREIFYILDGDDQFLGRQVLKTMNAVYQKERVYTLYSQFLIFNPRGKEPVTLGISQNYPAFVTKVNDYRWYKHSYGHLRTMISDFFLLTRAQSMQNDKGNFYWILYDNALYYPALEMSCQKVQYIPELMHWYNGNTGANDYIHSKDKDYSEAKVGIDREKPYRCIEDVFRELKRSQV